MLHEALWAAKAHNKFRLQMKYIMAVVKKIKWDWVAHLTTLLVTKIKKNDTKFTAFFIFLIGIFFLYFPSNKGTKEKPREGLGLIFLFTALQEMLALIKELEYPKIIERGNAILLTTTIF